MKNLILAIAGISSCILAGDPVELDTVRVVERPIVETVSRDGYRVIPVDKKLGADQIADILSQQPGVQTRVTGGVGSFQTVTIRSVAGSRIGVFVDGVPQTSALGGAVDLTRFSGLDIKEIELYSGLVPASLGGNSLGGAINIITNNQRSQKLAGSFSSLLGRYGEFKSAVTLNYPIKEIAAMRGSLEYHRAENDYFYLDRNGTYYGANPESDDAVRAMENNQFNHLHFTTGTTLNTKRSQLNLHWSFRDRMYHIPSGKGVTFSLRNKTAYESSRENQWTLSQKYNKKNALTWQLNGVTDNSSFYWTGHDNLPFPYNLVKNDDADELNRLNWYINGNVQGDFLLNELIRINSRLDLRHESLVPQKGKNGLSTGDWKSGRQSGGVASDFYLYPLGLELMLGGTITGYYSEAEGQPTGHGLDTIDLDGSVDHDWALRGSVHFPCADERIVLYTMGVFSHRIPTLREIYGVRGSLSNSDLKSESGRSGEVGVSWRSSKISAEAAFFANHFTNLIMPLRYGPVTKADNIGESRAFGVEQSLNWQIVPLVKVIQNLTLQKTKNLSEDKSIKEKDRMLPDQPKLTVQGELAIGPLAGVTLRPRAEYRSRFYRDLTNSYAVPLDSTLNGVFQYSFFLNWEYKKFTLEAGVLDLNGVGNTARDMDRIENSYYNTLYPGWRWQGQIRYNF